MSAMSPEEVAQGYAAVSDVVPPSTLLPGWTSGDVLSLVRSVDPRQRDLLAACAETAGAEWVDVHRAVDKQRDTRARLFDWVSEIDVRRTGNSESYVFPDAYSLLLWIWTFQLFPQIAVGPGAAWKKYLYRGESRDNGPTRFTPTVMRSNDPRVQRADFPSLLRIAVSRHSATVAAADRSLMGPSFGRFLLENMSAPQALAVGQHYGVATPLLDVTTNPEVALYFATTRSKGDIGVVGYWEHNGREVGDLAIVMAPPMFERIHRQSGYFICTQPGQPPPLTTLAFHHCPSVEPVRPTWLVSIGRSAGSDAEILGDDNRLEDLFRRLAREPVADPAPSVPAGQSTVDEMHQLTRFALTTIMGGAGRFGIAERGRRFADVRPALMFVLFRYAPAHLVMMTKLLHSVSGLPGRKPIRPLADHLVEVLRRLLVSTINDQVDDGRIQEVPTTFDGEQVLDTLMQFATLSPDVLPWPLSAWYSA